MTDDLEWLLGRAELLFLRLRGSRLCITGGTGFFGRWLLTALRHANDRLGLRLRIAVLSRDPAAFLRTAPQFGDAELFEWRQGDVRSAELPAGTFPFVIHAATAASAALNRDDPQAMFDTIVDGTRRVLEFAARAQAQAVLLTSSGAVYGTQPGDLAFMPETYMGGPDPLDVHSAYAEGKRAAESMSAASGLPVKIARGFAFVGPHLPLDAHFAAGNFIGDAVAGRPIVVQGDGTPLRSYLYAADLVVWLLKILLDGAAGRPYNVGSDAAVSVAELARRVAALSGSEVIVSRPAGAGAPARYVPAIDRARDELGLDVWTPLDVALARTLDWARTRNPMQ